MGLRINELDHLLAFLKKRGIPKRAVTIGRMDVFVSLPTIKSLCRTHKLTITERKPSDEKVYLDEVLQWLGVAVVDSVDYSDFEGATIIHDMSKPLTTAITPYDLVYESGTLEHIFNFPVALENVLSLCAFGGQVVLNTPCNNQAGHGFYQFSPELYFSAFRDSGAFSLEAVEVYEDFDNSPRYRVVDPKAVRRRVEIRSVLPVNMTVMLTRVNEAADIRLIEPGQVLQTDYVYAWDKREIASTGSRPIGVPYSSAQRNRRGYLLKADQFLRGLIRWYISTKRRSFYVGSPRSDLVKIETDDHAG